MVALVDKKRVCLYRDNNDALIFVGNMMGGMTHGLDVSIGNETSHTYAYFKKRMEHCMAATLCLLFPYVRSHMIDLCLWENSLTWDEFWKDMCYLSHIQLTPLILYYFQALEKLRATRRWWDGHLLYYVLRQQEEEQCWSQWRDYCHHPIYHMKFSPCFF